LVSGQIVLLDALWPPAPADLVRDVLEVGAAGCWLYVARWDAQGRWMGTGGCTPGHAIALRAHGLACPGIVVPGNAPPSDLSGVQSALGWFGTDPRTAFDLEAYSFPSAAWLMTAAAAVRQLGHLALRYGDGPTLALRYPELDGDWWSHGAIPVRAGWAPADGVPELPAGLVADQFAVEASINGHSYDVSVADAATFTTTAPDPAPQEDPMAVISVVIAGDEDMAGSGPHPGAQFVTDDCVTRRWVQTGSSLSSLIAAGLVAMGPAKVLPQSVIDEIPIVGALPPGK
jgi:hypothetical protein